MHFNPQSNMMPDTGRGDDLKPGQASGERARGGLRAGVITLVCGVGVTIGVWIWREGGGPQKVLAAYDAINEGDAGDGPAAPDAADSFFGADESGSKHTVVAGLFEIPADLLNDERTVDERQARSRQLYQSARSHMSFGRHHDAMPYLTEAVELDPQFAHARYQLGLAHVMTGSIDAARSDHAKLRPLDPSLANLLGNLIRSQRESH